MSDARKIEEQRQTNLLAKAIQEAIEQTARNFGTPPMLNSVAGALVTVQASMLVSIEDARTRKMLRKVMERSLAQCLLSVRPSLKTETIVIGGPRQ